MEDDSTYTDRVTNQCETSSIYSDDDAIETSLTDDPDIPPMIPYEPSIEDDDDTDFPFPTDPRYLDYGWDGACLQDPEDIDFEFVYALHTFVATVEGQANATKGDTMVLLDDSNSYWWLVRLVKDSSIGRCCYYLYTEAAANRT